MLNYLEFNSSLKNNLKYLIPDGVREKIHPRRFQCFSIGAPKSGTTSIAGMFNKNFRASHEPERRSIIYSIQEHYNKNISDDDFIHKLRKRDKRVWLEIESNCFLGYRIDLLYRAFPGAKFIMSVRSPRSWLDSMMNHTINYPPSSEDVIKIWHSIFFRHSEFEYTKFDHLLKDYNVYPIESYLRFWAKSIEDTLNTIPREQLLIVDTLNFDDSINNVVKFLDIQRSDLDFCSSHLNKAPEKYHLLEKIDDCYLREVIDNICTPIQYKLNSIN
ncbi:sulfotransferase [Pleionea sediminis]|uniref:sulfotransferase n=1 Tax=Pleionea sediminis TaxID=2569479 RepID=UPI001184EADC|nr:sulfotransferase [Pleionea sediminis]